LAVVARLSYRTQTVLRIARRLAIIAVTLLLVSVLVFVATQGMPGDVARAVLGRDATPEQLLRVRLELGLDRPLAVQYADWLVRLLSGDPGLSIVARMPVLELIGPKIRNSAELVLVSMAVTLPSSLVLGLITAWRRDGWLDRALMAVSIGVNALPEFVLGMLLVAIFATNLLRILPAVSVIPPGDSPFDHPAALVLPALTLIVLGTMYLYRLVRASLIDALSCDYVEMAVLKGLPTSRIMWRHALPNAVVPMIQATAVVLAYMVGGAVVVEYVYAFPGLGSALTEAVGQRDLPVVQFIVIVIAATYFLANALADLLADIYT
jgi:peptide/nickel transport system permease protein